MAFRLTADGRAYRKGRRIYANKDVYEGEFVEGLKHGKGILRYQNGNKYVGEFVNDFPEGFGTFSYVEYGENGERSGRHRYEGEFKRGKRHGKGLYVSANGDTYTGMFENNVYHGTGTLKLKNGDVFEGEWKKGRARGLSNTIKYHNGDLYVGAMKAGFIHGTGEYKWRKNQGSYQGDWFKGQPQGRGIRIFLNGNKFTGSFYDGRINGDGVMSYANGDQYIGSWLNGHKHGKGVLRFATGDRYEGDFYHGYFYGQGKFVWSDGSYYEGEYRKTAINKVTGVTYPTPDGKRNGLGLRVWTNGNRYEGDWLDDIIHGKGVLQKVEGGKYRGEFWNGLRGGVGSEEFGNTSGVPFRCPMGTKHRGDGFCLYTGQFQKGYFHGIGEFTCQNGRVYSGEWCEGKRHGKGTQTYLLEGEAGDPKRLFIGGVGSLYRFKEYDGEWVDDEKEGQGVATYVNDDSIEGNFTRGQPHGVLLYRFANGTAERYATYLRGQRVEWTSDVAVNMKKALAWLDDAASFRREFRNEPNQN